MAAGARSTDSEFVLAREFDAPRALVFDAWTDPEKLVKWFGPRGLTNRFEGDVAPGRAFRLTMIDRDRTEFPIVGKFLEVVRPERLVYSQELSEHPESWHDVMTPERDRSQPPPRHEAVVTVTFEPLGERTRLTIHMKFDSARLRARHVALGMREGWAQSLDVVDELLAGATPVVLHRAFDAARDQVWRAWSDAGQLRSWWTSPLPAIVENVPPERIVGRHSIGGVELQTTVSFAELNGRTELLVATRPFANGDDARRAFEDTKARIETDLNGELDRLANHLTDGEEAMTTEATSDRALVASRVFDAPRELVWQAFSEPQHLARWWGPKGFTNTIHEFDFRAGGVWRLVMHGPDGKDYENESVFVELVKPEKVVLDHTSWPHFRLTFTFATEGGGTRVTMHQLFDTAETRAQVRHYAEPANHENLEKLESVVRGLETKAT